MQNTISYFFENDSKTQKSNNNNVKQQEKLSSTTSVDKSFVLHTTKLLESFIHYARRIALAYFVKMNPLI